MPDQEWQGKLVTNQRMFWLVHRIHYQNAVQQVKIIHPSITTDLIQHSTSKIALPLTLGLGITDVQQQWFWTSGINGQRIYIRGDQLDCGIILVAGISATICSLYHPWMTRMQNHRCLSSRRFQMSSHFRCRMTLLGLRLASSNANTLCLLSV